MSQTIKTYGIVLNAMPVGDYDKRVVLLTKEKGKISAFAKGARRPNSHLLAGSQVFASGEYLIYLGRTSNSITQTNLQASFYQLRDDIEALSYGLYFNELIDYMTEENMITMDYLELLFRTLNTLVKQQMPNDLIRSIFELKILSMSGYTPEVTQCLKSGCEMQPLHWFSAIEGGVLCEAHHLQVKDPILISEGVRYTMQYILSAPLQQLYSFNLKEAIHKELQMILKCYMTYHLDHNFKTIEFINNLHQTY